MEESKIKTARDQRGYNTFSNDDETYSDKNKSRTIWMIYVSHTLSSWGDRMWAFAFGLFLVILHPESLLLTAAYGFVQCFTVILLGAVIGKWIDKSSRLDAARVSLLIQNLSVFIGAISLALLLQFNTEIKALWNGYLEIIALSIMILLAVTAELGSVANTIAIEKDWLVVLSHGDETKLSNLNSTMRTIDLCTFILAPIFVGQILTYVSQIAGAILIASWNLISVIVEYLLLTAIYKVVPELAEKKCATSNEDFVEDEACVSEIFGSDDEIVKRRPNRLQSLVADSWKGWKAYFSHPIRDAGLALSMLYMTVLGFDSVTTGFAYTQGVDESLLGMITAIGAVFGILGSVSFPFLRRSIGKTTTGNIGFGSEVVSLLLCVVSVFALGSPFKPEAISDPFNINSNSTGSKEIQVSGLSLKELWNEHTTVFYLMGGIILSRYGLWVADLSVTQILQEEVHSEQRGILNGVQGSLNQLMNLLKFFLVIIFPSTELFGYLIIGSWIFVCFG